MGTQRDSLQTRRTLTTPLSHGKSADDSHGEDGERHVLRENLLEIGGERLALFSRHCVRQSGTLWEGGFRGLIWAVKVQKGAVLPARSP